MKHNLDNYVRSALEASVHFARDRSAVEQFVLRYGQTFTPISHGVPRGPEKKCFSNAADLVSSDRRYSYAEGFSAAAGMPPFIHAWCTRDGFALDPTLKRTHRYAYLGVVIPRQILFDALEQQGHYGILTGSRAATFMEEWARSRG